MRFFGLANLQQNSQLDVGPDHGGQLLDDFTLAPRFRRRSKKTDWQRRRQTITRRNVVQVEESFLVADVLKSPKVWCNYEGKLKLWWFTRFLGHLQTKQKLEVSLRCRKSLLLNQLLVHFKDYGFLKVKIPKRLGKLFSLLEPSLFYQSSENAVTQ